MQKVIENHTLRYDRDLFEQMDWLVLKGIEDCEGEYGATIIDASNWACAIEQFDTLGTRCDWSKEAGLTGDWDIANGLIIVRPDSSAAQLAEEIENALENYPLLDEMDYSQRECEAYGEAWDNWACADFIRHIRSNLLADNNSDGSAIEYWLEDLPKETLRELFEDSIRSGDWYHEDSDGIYVNIRNWNMSRDDFAQWIRAQRRNGRRHAALENADLTDDIPDEVAHDYFAERGQDDIAALFR